MLNKRVIILCFCYVNLIISSNVLGDDFSFEPWLLGNHYMFKPLAVSVDVNSGAVVIGNHSEDSVDNVQQIIFDWDDGSQETVVFDSTHQYYGHQYTNLNRNYTMKATCEYTDGYLETIEILIRFVAPSVNPQPLPTELEVTIPNDYVDFDSRIDPNWYDTSKSQFLPMS